MYRASAKQIRRSDGRSATAAAAYRAAIKIVDNRTGEVHDYRRKHHVLAKGLIGPDGTCPPLDRSALWNLAEITEKRSNAVTAQEWQITLPRQLTDTQNMALAGDLAMRLAQQEKTLADWSFHKPHSRPLYEEYTAEKVANPHIHILLLTREWENGILTRKCDSQISGADRKKRTLSTSKKQDLVATRAMIADVINCHLEKAGLDFRVDHRSFADQGVAFEPLENLSRAEVAAELAGVITAKGECNRKRLADRHLLSQLSKTVAEIKSLEAAIAQKAAIQAEKKSVSQLPDDCHFRSPKMVSESEFEEDDALPSCRFTP